MVLSIVVFSVIECHSHSIMTEYSCILRVDNTATTAPSSSVPLSHIQRDQEPTHAIIRRNRRCDLDNLLLAKVIF